MTPDGKVEAFFLRAIGAIVGTLMLLSAVGDISGSAAIYREDSQPPSDGLSQVAPVTFTQTGGPVGGIVRAFAIDPVNPQILYVGSPGSTLPSPMFKTTDGGEQWAQVGSSIDATFIFHIAVDPLNPSTVYSAFAAEPPANGLFKSVDSGQSWTRLAGAIATEKATAITVDPRNSNVLYLGTRDGKLFRSVDGGSNWVRKSDGLPTNVVFAISKIAVDPLNSNVVYLSTGWWDDVGGVGLYKSVDGGESWTAINNGVGRVRTFNNIAINPLNTQELYATGSASLIPGEARIPEFGVYKSVNGALSWTRVGGVPHPTVGAVGLAINPKQPQVVYVGGETGLLARTSDGGATWQTLAVPPNPVVTHVLVDPINPETVYAGTYHGGLFKSTDGGQSWGFADTGYVATWVHALAVDPNDSNIIYTGNMGDSVQATVDAGTTWRRLNDKEYAFSGAGAIAIHPQNSSVIFVGTEYGKPGRLYRTTNGGANWTQILDTGQPQLSNYHVTHVTDIAAVPGPPDVLFVSVAGVGIFKSEDGGGRWKQVTTGLTSPWVSSVKFDTVNRIAYAATLGGVFKSVDQGETWRPANSGLTNPELLAIALDPVDPRVIYAGAKDGKLFRSLDSAATWSQVFAYTQTVPFPLGGLPTFALAIDPVNPSTVYVAYLEGAVFRTRDRGSTWAQIADLSEFRSQLHPSLALDAKGKTLYVGTLGLGLFRAVLSPFAEVSLSAPPSEAGNAGKTVLHTFKLRNKGNVPDTFDLKVASSRGWRSEIAGPPTAGPLRPGQTADISVRVTVPSGTAAGVQDNLTLTATSRLDSRESSSASVATASLGLAPPAFGATCDTPGTPATTAYLPNITKTLGGPTGWVTPFIVQNIGSSTTTLEVSFHGFADGSLVTCRTIPDLAPGTSYADYPNNDADLPDNSQFGVVVRAFGAPVVAVVNEHQSEQDPVRAVAMSYVGLTTGAANVYLPYVAKTSPSWVSTFIMQNLGSATTTVTISFRRYDGQEFQTLSRTIAPGRSAFVDPRGEPTLEGGFYAVTLTSAQPIGVVVNNHNDESSVPTPSVYSYNGVAAPSGTTTYLPYLARNTDGLARTTTLYVQNAGAATATPALSFAKVGATTTASVGGTPIGPGDTWVYEIGTATALSDGEWAATVSGGSFAVLARTLTAATAMGYTGTSLPGKKLYLPNITRTLGGASGWTTPILLQSAGAASAKLSWYRFADGALVTTQNVSGLTSGATTRIDPRSVAGLSDDTQYAVVIEATGGPVYAITTEMKAGGDNNMIYEAFVDPASIE